MCLLFFNKNQLTFLDIAYNKSLYQYLLDYQSCGCSFVWGRDFINSRAQYVQTQYSLNKNMTMSNVYTWYPGSKISCATPSVRIDI